MSETTATKKAAFWVGIVFLAGAAVGGMGGYGYARRSVAAAASPQLPEPERRAKRVAELTQELSLSNEQAKQLDAILLEWHGRVKAIHDESDAQIDQLRQKGREQVRAILTAEQKPKFEEFLKKLDEERKRNAGK